MRYCFYSLEKSGYVTSVVDVLAVAKGVQPTLGRNSSTKRKATFSSSSLLFLSRWKTKFPKVDYGVWKVVL